MGIVAGLLFFFSHWPKLISPHNCSSSIPPRHSCLCPCFPPCPPSAISRCSCSSHVGEERGLSRLWWDLLSFSSLPVFLFFLHFDVHKQPCFFPDDLALRRPQSVIFFYLRSSFRRKLLFSQLFWFLAFFLKGSSPPFWSNFRVCFLCCSFYMCVHPCDHCTFYEGRP